MPGRSKRGNAPVAETPEQSYTYTRKFSIVDLRGRTMASVGFEFELRRVEVAATGVSARTLTSNDVKDMIAKDFGAQYGAGAPHDEEIYNIRSEGVSARVTAKFTTGKFEDQGKEQKGKPQNRYLTVITLPIIDIPEFMESEFVRRMRPILEKMAARIKETIDSIDERAAGPVTSTLRVGHDKSGATFLERTDTETHA